MENKKKFPKLSPQINPEFRLIKPKKKVEKINEEINEVIEKPPDFLITQYNFYYQIIIDVIYEIIIPDEFGNIKISDDIMKQYYNNVCDLKTKKIYGRTDLQRIFSLFRYRKGIKYDSKKNIWTINISLFLEEIFKEYQEDIEVYGKNFM